VITEFLTQTEGVGQTAYDVLVLGATNLPWDLDDAMIRRFQKRVYIPLPDAKAREEMVKIHLGDTPNNLSNADFEVLGEETEGFSGSDIDVLVTDALMEPFRRCKRTKQFKLVSGFYVPCEEEYPNCDDCEKSQRTCRTCRARWMQIRNVPKGKLKVPDVEMRDFVIVLKNLRASVPKDQIEDYEQWTTELGQSGMQKLCA
jgi:vacuolar protein-sorting-associated protein 4